MANSVHRRAAERVPSDLRLEFSVPGSKTKGSGQVRDLSDSGAQFTTYQNLSPGTKIHIRIPFGNPKIPALMAPAVVVRCRVVAGGDGYAVGCAFD